MSIFRSRSDRKIAGVCGGLAQYFNIDSSLVRLGWILLTLASAGLGILIYLLFIFIFPEESSEQTAS
ncbi:MAG: PspC domain-containing protein [Calditrichaeota bacterium]|nr:MAG: PspC domain-containing protein [Calditrichota bacterium]